MNAIEILNETWQEYIARRKLERTPIVEISWSEELRTHFVRFEEAAKGKVWIDETVWIDDLGKRRDS